MLLSSIAEYCSIELDIPNPLFMDFNFLVVTTKLL